MIQLTYEPALDPFHAVYRVLRLRSIIANCGPLPRDHVRILDFYQLFPFCIDHIRLARQHRRFRKLASDYKAAAPYGDQPEDRILFNRMEPMQIAALETLATHGLIDPEQWNIGEVRTTESRIPEALAGRIEAANEHDRELHAFLSVLASEYNLTGVNGLKDRTGLMEYRHDAV
jgi:hypothetical protein